MLNAIGATRRRTHFSQHAQLAAGTEEPSRLNAHQAVTKPRAPTPERPSLLHRPHLRFRVAEKGASVLPEERRFRSVVSHTFPLFFLFRYFFPASFFKRRASGNRTIRGEDEGNATLIQILKCYAPSKQNIVFLLL